MSLAVLFGFSNSALAEQPQGTDFGRIGATYEIAEPDLIEFLKGQLQEKMDSGEIQKEHEAMTERGKRYARRPPGVKLPATEKYAAVQLDPVYTTESDILDAEGNVLYAAGTKVHPLKIIPFQRVLCFIDGDEPQQVQWARRFCTEGHDKRIVLTNGDIEETWPVIGKRIYFDQYAWLTNSLGIVQVPAVVRQSGEFLYVEYFPADWLPAAD